MRSRTGCLTCRRRKLKCDERKPVCGQCQKASRECVPSSGIVFRHQHNASMNGNDFDSENNLKGFYAYKDTFDSDAVWLDIPKHITFLNTTNPYTDPLLSESETSSTPSNSPRSEPTTAPSWTTPTGSQSLRDTTPNTVLEPFPPFFADDLPLQTSFLGPPEQDSFMFLSPISTSLPSSSIATHPWPVRPTPSVSAPPIPSGPFPLLDTNTSPPPRSTPQPRRPQPRAGIRSDSREDQEVAFLLRHFSEGPGRWVDLFDLGSYFASYVPVKAVDNAILRYAAAAYSAKSLSRKHKNRPPLGTDTSGQIGSEASLNVPPAEWYRKATEYYDKAVCLLLEALRDCKAVTTGPTIEGPSDFQSYPDLKGVPARKRRRTNSNLTASSYTDEILAAIAILGLYEFLDGSIPEWVKHLNGARSVLGALQEQVKAHVLIENAPPLSAANLCFASKAQQAIFWNIARQDMLAAFINNSHTRMDTEDYALWRGAGLPIDDNGLIFPNNASDLFPPETEIPMTEDVVCISLIWLMAKVMNFLASGCDPPHTIPSPQTRLTIWLDLQVQFQRWYNCLPASFQPTPRIDPRVLSHGLNESFDPSLFPDIWYSIPMCASAMQSYHMSQILLLLNKPPEPAIQPGPPPTTIDPYTSLLLTSQSHARAIISISLSRSDESVLIHSIQPLFTAGQCLREPRERRLVTSLLKHIETNIGWATEYRVRLLSEVWRRQEVEALAVPCTNLVGSLSLEEIGRVREGELGVGF